MDYGRCCCPNGQDGLARKGGGATRGRGGLSEPKGLRPFRGVKCDEESIETLIDPGGYRPGSRSR